MLRLRDYQRASLDALAAAWGRGGGDAAAPGHLVVLPTGAGKTFVAQLAMRDTPRSTLICVPTLDLLQQWYSGLVAAFPQQALKQSCCSQATQARCCHRRHVKEVEVRTAACCDRRAERKIRYPHPVVVIEVAEQKLTGLAVGSSRLVDQR